MKLHGRMRRGLFPPLPHFPSGRLSPARPEQTHASWHLQYTLALSAVEGAGWSGTWVFRVTYNAQTEDVWFQTSLAQRKGAFGTTAGGDQVQRIDSSLRLCLVVHSLFYYFTPYV